MEQQNNKTDETAGRPELTQEQIGMVDALLMRWASAGLCVYGKNNKGTTVVRVDGLIRMLRTLAHCAVLAGMQDLVTGRSDENRGPDMAIGFIAAAKVVSYLAAQCSTDAVKLCKSDPHEYLRETWNEIAGSRDHVIDDIERVAPGWYARAQELMSARKEPIATPADLMDPEVADRIRKAKAGIRVTETGDLRLQKVTDRLYAYLGRPEELRGVIDNAKAEVIRKERAKTWSDALVEFIGGYEDQYGERLSDNEVRYLEDLVNARLTPDRQRGYSRIIGAEKRDTRFRAEDFIPQEPETLPENPITAETASALQAVHAMANSGAPVLTQGEVDRMVEEGINDDRPIGAPVHD